MNSAQKENMSCIKIKNFNGCKKQYLIWLIIIILKPFKTKRLLIFYQIQKWLTKFTNIPPI